MKLRIQGNSLRLRLSEDEVAQLHDCGRVESSIEFTPGCSLVYLLEVSRFAHAVTAHLDDHAIRVTAPARVIAEWAENQQVSIEATSPAGLHLLVEKDFPCLHKPDQQTVGAYPHPLISSFAKLNRETYDEHP